MTNMPNRSDDALRRLGLNVREHCDMMTYWLLQLEAYPFNALYFADVPRYAKAAGLRIVPSPDVVIRVLMAFRYHAFLNARPWCAWTTLPHPCKSHSIDNVCVRVPFLAFTGGLLLYRGHEEP